MFIPQIFIEDQLQHARNGTGSGKPRPLSGVLVEPGRLREGGEWVAGAMCGGQDAGREGQRVWINSQMSWGAWWELGLQP